MSDYQTYSPEDIVTFTMTRQDAARIGSMLSLALVFRSRIGTITQALDKPSRESVRVALCYLAGQPADTPFTRELFDTAMNNTEAVKKIGARFVMEAFHLYEPEIGEAAAKLLGLTVDIGLSTDDILPLNGG